MNEWWKTYEDQLDPELLARVEEWQREQTLARAEPMTPEEVEEMVRTPVRQPIPKSVVRDFLITGGWTIKRRRDGRTGFPPGRPTSWPEGAPEEVLAGLRWSVGYTREEFDAIIRRDRRPRTQKERWQRDTLCLNLARVIEEGRGQGIVRHLADAYGVGKGTIARCGAHGRELAELLPALRRSKG